MQFEWDAEKERVNIKKHGIDFETAALVFDDINRIEFYDDIHSSEEDRYITVYDYRNCSHSYSSIYRT